MSSSACCSPPNTYECHWNCDHGFKCDLTVKANVPRRRKREFTPDELKDDNYWMKRSRNNEAAKRSRERRRMEERLLEERALQLLRENEKLKATLSAINYHRTGNQTSSYDASFIDPAPELSRDSYLRALVSFPGANRAPHYARCDFSSAYDSVHFPRMQSFSASSSSSSSAAASFPAVDNARQRDGYLRIHAPSDPPSACRNIPYALTPRAWSRSRGQGHAHPPVNVHPNSALFSLNEMVPGYQRPAGSTPRCAAHTRTNATYGDQPSFLTEPKELCKEVEMVKEAERVSTSPLLPHKLRYKVNKLARRGGERALFSPGISHYIQE